jgi:hypothetical protein
MYERMVNCSKLGRGYVLNWAEPVPSMDPVPPPYPQNGPGAKG